VQLSRTRLGHNLPAVAAASAMRLVVSPALAWGLARLFAFPPQVAAVVVVAAGFPVAVNVYILAAEYRHDEEIASQSIFVTTLASALDKAGYDAVIGVSPDQIQTKSLRAELPAQDGQVRADPARDLLKVAVFDRHTASGRIGLGLASGFGLTRGALATTVAHDAHPLVVVGASDADMEAAARSVIASGGGQAVVADGQVVARLALPLAGLLSPEPAEKVAVAEASLRAAAHDLGSRLPDPFATLSFLALPVIPSLRITDEGLVDVDRFEPVPLFES